MKVAARSDVGRRRANNQDTIYYSATPVGVLPNLVIVADGMGGHKAGEVASEMTVKGMVRQICEASEASEEPQDLLLQAAALVNRAVFTSSQEVPEWNGMGTTLVAATFSERRMYCINVGDSRLYALSAYSDGTMTLRQVTEDHSYVGELLREGLITPEEARSHPQKNVITRTIGYEPSLQADVFELPLADIRSVLLCSDGLTDMVTDDEIERVLIDTVGDPERAVETLKNMANANGGVDNISVIVVSI